MPHIDYCNIIWCNNYPTYIKKVEVLQKKVIRAISWSKLDAPSNPIFHKLSLLKLNECNYLHNACIMYNVVNKLNNRLCDLIPISYPSHTYDTRNTDHIQGKKRDLICTSQSVVCRGPEVWNELETKITLSTSLFIFKKSLRQQLLRKYT